MPRVLLPNLLLPASRINLYRPGRSAAAMTMEALNSAVSSTGADGIEIVPGNFLHVAELLTSTPSRAARIGRGVMALQQSFVDTNPLPADKHRQRRSYHRGSAAKRLMMRSIFSGGETSLQRMEKIAERLDQPVQTIVYPDKYGDQDADARLAKRFKGAAVQLNADVLAAWGAESPQAVIDALSRRNLSVIWDTFNSDRAGKSSTRSMQGWDYLPALLQQGMVSGVRIGVFRDDFLDVDKDRCELSIKEGVALTQGKRLSRLPLGEMLGQLADADWQGNVTIAASPTGLQKAYDERLSFDHTLKLYGAMVDNVRAHLPHMQADWESFPANN